MVAYIVPAYLLAGIVFTDSAGLDTFYLYIGMLCGFLTLSYVIDCFILRLHGAVPPPYVPALY